MKPATLLLIEDNPVFLGILIGFLERSARHSVTVVGTARSAEEGVELAARLRPEAVSVDVELPGKSGLEIIPRLREVLPEAAIVVLTQHEQEPFQEMARTAGAADYVTKAQFHTH